MDGTTSFQWTHVIESLIGTFAGALVALCSMWIKERIETRKAVQAWFEQYYITEGLDPVLSYLHLSQQYILMNPRALENKKSLKKFLGDPPLQALHRVGELVHRAPFAGTLAGAVLSLAGVRTGEREFTIYQLDTQKGWQRPGRRQRRKRHPNSLRLKWNRLAMNDVARQCSMALLTEGGPVPPWRL